MKLYTLIAFSIILLISKQWANAQVTIGADQQPNTNAVLDLVSSSKGLLLPRIGLSSTTSQSPLAAHTVGMVVYNTSTTGDVYPGYYYNDGQKWLRLAIANTESIVNKTLNYTLTISDNTIISGNGATITLPAASAMTGKIFRLVSGGGASTITGEMKLTGGVLSSYGLNTTDWGRGITVQSDGSYWVIIQRF